MVGSLRNGLKATEGAGLEARATWRICRSSASRSGEKRTRITSAAAKRTATPMIMRASAVARDSIRKRNPKATAPAFPPAPTMPATEPKARRLMKGTTENVAPSDIWTKRLKTTMAPMARKRVAIWENMTRAMPSRRRTIPRNTTRPRSPNLMPNLSPKAPPRVRANMFIAPKRPAMKPAIPMLSSKRSW